MSKLVCIPVVLTVDEYRSVKKLLRQIPGRSIPEKVRNLLIGMTAFHEIYPDRWSYVKSKLREILHYYHHEP